jgi:hypothetical protein
VVTLRPRLVEDTVYDIVRGPQQVERTRLKTIDEALKPALQPTVILPPTAPKNLRDYAAKARTNYLPLVLDVMSQSLVVDGYRQARSADNSRAWDDVWQRNGFDARQVGVHRAALAYGVAYATVLPGDPAPRMRGVSPLRMTALYQDAVEDEWPMLALRDDGTTVRLYDEEAEYVLTRETVASPFRYTETRPHGAGVCPVVRYRERMLLDDDPLGVIEPLLPIQGRIDETVFGLMIAQYYGAFKQRWIVGWVPASEQQMLQAGASQVWTFKDDTVKLGEFTETSLAGYIESQRSGVVDMAAISQVPAHQLGGTTIANLSAEALEALQNGKELKADEVKASLGESHEQALRLGAAYLGDAEAAADLSSQVRWRDVTARSLAQVADALGKLAQSLGIPPRALWAKIPGVTDQDLELWGKLADQPDSFQVLAATLQQQAAPTSAADAFAG